MAAQTEVSEAHGATILMVDDDPGICEAVSEFLGRHGYRVETASDAREMDAVLQTQPVDLLVLDIMLPGEDGRDVCRRLAGRGRPPIIMLSAMGDDQDRITGLELGADDYLSKPCNPRELLARIRAVLRRADHAPADEPRGVVYEFAGWRLDLLRRELRSPTEVVIELSSGESSLMRAMAEHPQQVLSREQLLELARGPEPAAFDRAIDVQISRLRRKLDLGQGEQPLIRTVRNEGYLLAAEVRRA